MVKFISILIICYFVYWIAKIVFRMFLRKITNNLTGQGTSEQRNYNSPNYTNSTSTKNSNETKKKFYDPDKIEEAKFEELK